MKQSQKISEMSGIDAARRIKTQLKNYKRQFEGNQKEERRAYHGEIWQKSDGRRPYENKVWPIIESQVPILSDSMPAPIASTKDPAFIEQTKNLSKAIQYVSNNQNFGLILPSLIRNQLIDGVAFEHLYYDANANNGDGRICSEIVPWDKVYISGESPFIENCSKVRIELDRTRSWLELNYPDHKEKLESAKAKVEIQDDKGNGYELKDVGNGPQSLKPPKPYQDEDTLCLVKTFVKDYSLKEISQEQTDEELTKESKSIEENLLPELNKWQDHKYHIEIHSLVLAELYAELEMSPEMGQEAATQAVEEIIAQNPDAAEQFNAILQRIAILEDHIEEHAILAEENPEGKQLKYKNALRCIETVGEIELYDGESRDDHACIPLVPYHCYINGTPFSYGEIRNILDPQRMMAVMTYKDYKGKQKVSNPIVEYNKSFLSEDNVTNEDGALYGIPEGESWAIRHVSPGATNPQLSQFNSERMQAMQEISGVNEATQGELPNPQASGVAIQKVQNQAIGRIRLKDRQNQYYSIVRRGKLIANLIIQYWHTEKVLKLEDLGQEPEQIIFNPIEMQDLDFDIEISQGSMSGIDKDMHNSLMISYLNNGHITFKEYLEVADLPSSKKLLEMVSERENMQAELEQAQTENIKLKAQIDPALLSKEEMAIYEQIVQEEQLQQLQEQPAVTPDQAANIGVV